MSGKVLAWLTFLVAGGIAAPAIHNAPAADSSTPPARATFFVATDGNDAWSGRLAVAERRADRRAVCHAGQGPRRAAGNRPQGANYPAGGHGPRRKVFPRRDAGDRAPRTAAPREAPVVYTAYPGEKPILSGGRKVTGWQPYKGKSSVLRLPGTKGGKWKFRRLFADGKLQVRARWPKLRPAATRRTAAGRRPRARPRRTATAPSATSRARFRAIGPSPPRAKSTSFTAISTASGATTSSRSRASTKRSGSSRWSAPTRDFDRPSWFWATPFQPDTPFRRSRTCWKNLDQPGEWCLDSEEGKLYFWPPGGSIEGLEVVAPALDRLVALHRTSFVTIRGFTFTETTDGDEPQPGGVEGLGAMFCRARAEVLRRGPAPEPRRVVPDRGQPFRRASAATPSTCKATTPETSSAATRSATPAPTASAWAGRWATAISSTSRAAVHTTSTPRQAGPRDRWDELEPTCNTRCSTRSSRTTSTTPARSTTSRPASSPRSPRTTSSGTTRSTTCRTHAINLGSSGLSRNIIEYNDIRRTCQTDRRHRRPSTAGPTPRPRNAARQGHIIRYNLIVDSRGHGIYLDDYTSNCFVYGNVILRPAEMGIHIHGGKNNVVENNLFIGARMCVAYDDAVSGRTPEMAGFSRGNRFCRNIVVDCKEKVLHPCTDWTERTVVAVGRKPVLQRGRRGGLSRQPPAAGLRGPFAHRRPAVRRSGPRRLSSQARLARALRLGFQPIDFGRIGPPAPPPPKTLRADLASPGRMLEGLGAPSAEASSRRLMEYPEPQRSQVLDFLIKPRWFDNFRVQ